MSEPTLRILHNPSCSTSRRAVETARALGHEPELVRYLSTPLSREQLLALIDRLEDEPADLVRKDRFFVEQRLDPDDYRTPEQVADLLVEHPRLLERPVIVRGDRAVIGRPTGRVEEFLGD